MRIIVQKFGGTSIATADGRSRAADRVERAVKSGFATVVVVSAMGRSGDPYATDTLIQLANSVCPEMALREMDLLLHCGEIISSVVMAAHLRTRQIPAVVFTGGQAGIITDEGFGSATVLKVDPQQLLRRLEDGLVVVVAGFQGRSASGEITTIGRGGSDTTAALIGGALQAEVVEIYTDVDGVKTADPRLVPEARTLSITTYDEIAQMAHYGAKVVHPRAVEVAMQNRIPLRIKSSFEDGPGTLITFSLETVGQAWSELMRPRPVTGVTHVTGLAQLQVPTPSAKPDSGLIFRSLAEQGISVDLINVLPEIKRFCVEERLAERAERTLRSIGFEPELRSGCAKVSIVGSGMRGQPGVMATVAEGLTAAGVEILQTADSHVTISCLVGAAQLPLAVQALHSAFDLENR